MPLIDVAPLEARIEITTPPARVWELVSDLPTCRVGVRRCARLSRAAAR